MIYSTLLYLATLPILAMGLINGTSYSIINLSSGTLLSVQDQLIVGNPADWNNRNSTQIWQAIRGDETQNFCYRLYNPASQSAVSLTSSERYSQLKVKPFNVNDAQQVWCLDQYDVQGQPTIYKLRNLNFAMWADLAAGSSLPGTRIVSNINGPLGNQRFIFVPLNG